MKRLLVALIFLVSICSPVAQAGGEPLKVLTINVWSGLDYNGTFKMGEYETLEVREARFRSLVAQVKAISPDIVFIQEANPVDKYAAKLASSLSMDEIHQVVNAGFKVGSLGIPLNMSEGIAILVKPELSLQKTGTWKLSGPKGVHSDLLSVHFSEVVLVLAGRVDFEGQEVALVNVHLVAAPRIPEDMDHFRDDISSRGELAEANLNEGIAKWQQREEGRIEEVKKLTLKLKNACSETPCIVAGDFNAEPGSAEIRLFEEQCGFIDVLGGFGDSPESDGAPFTWDVDRNANTSVSASTRDARGNVRKGFDYIAAVAGERNRRLDYIFLGKGFSRKDVLHSGVVLDEKVEGVQPSDHFGVFAEIDMADTGSR